MTVEAATQTIRVTMKKYVLQSILDRAFSVASRASAAQVLQNVKMEVDGGYVTVIGSDAEITMVVRTQQVDIGGTGVALIPPKIHDIVKLCPDMEITLDLDPLNAQASITCGTAFWQVKIEQDEYPDIDARHEPIITVPKDILNRRIAQVRPAIQTENIRAMFQFVQVKDQKIRGTDGSRLHQADFPYAFEAQFPARAIAEIVRRLRGMALDDVEIGETERHYSFKFDDDLLIATKHTIEYPDVVWTPTSTSTGRLSSTSSGAWQSQPMATPTS
jgi:DNA polymerase III sliding clamp (beta) subunit (PCNA family)